VFIFWSLRDSFPAQLLEAMAHGLPIITLNQHGAAGLVPEDAGIMVPVSDADTTADSIARAIELMHSDPGFRHECGRRGFARARGLTWGIRIADFEKIYRSVQDTPCS
jgi:glycosyltransferase involved in cell wall biosynthesis